MSRLKFEKINDLKGLENEDPLLITVDVSNPGPSKIMMEMLTATNKSVSYQVRQVSENLRKWHGFRNSNPGKADEMIAFYSKQLKELEKILHVDYYHEIDGKLVVPIGFWYLFKQLPDDLYKNTEMPVILAPSYLRDYQKDGVNALLQYKRATCVMATGLGKSLVLASICASAYAVQKRVCVVVPTEYLVQQVVNTVKTIIPSVCGVSSKRKFIPGSMVIVTTAGSALNSVSLADVVIFDESHHMSAKTWVDICLAAKAEYVYNLTATPFRADGLDLGIHAFGGPVIFELDSKWGIDQGWLAKPRFYCIEYTPRDSHGIPVRINDGMHSAKAYNALVCRNDFMEYLKVRLISAVKEGKRCIVLFKTVKAGIKFRSICGKDLVFNVASSAFKKPIHDFSTGACQVLISNDKLLSEGVDVPEADCMFQIIQNKSEVTTNQAIGRVMRKKPNNECVIVDITLTGYKSFETASLARRKVYARIGPIIVKGV